MPIFLKKSDGNWSTNAKKVFVKAADGLWKSATRVLAKTASGWIQMWPGDSPASSPTDPISIRLNSYTGTLATSPQFINTVLYGRDGTITGATPITITNRKMQLATDNTGQTDRYQVESVDIYDLTSNSETNVAEKRFYADGWWLFYQLDATNVWATTRLYSANPIKIIKQQPTFSTNSPVFTEDYTSVYPFFSLDFTFSDTWWKSADLSRSYVRWWLNTSKTPGGTILRTTYIKDIFGLSTTRGGGIYQEYDGQGTTVSGVDSYSYLNASGIPAGQYIIAEIVLINSYTDHYNSPVSVFKTTGDKAVITSLNVRDDNGNGVVDNQSTPRIMSDGWLNFTATVSGASATTVYYLEPRFYNWVNGNYYQFNTTTVISNTSFPTDLTPTSTTLSGSTATVVWRIYIDANILYGMGIPTRTTTGTASRWDLEFRVSARPTTSTPNAQSAYFTGVASLGGDNVYLGGIDLPGSVSIAPSTAMTLNVDQSTSQVGQQRTFNIVSSSYPSGYASYPRKYYIDFGDNTNTGWVNFATGTNNPSVLSINKTYSNTGTYTATLIWEPQGDTGRSTRSRTITVSPALSAPTSVSIASVSRATDSSVTVNLNHSGGSGPYYQMYWTTSSSPVITSMYDSASTSSSSISDTFTVPSTPYNAYFYVRSSSENLGTTNTGGSATIGTYSSYSSLSPNPSYNFTVPSGGTASISGSTTPSSTLTLTTSSPSASPAADGITIVWRIANGGTGGNSFTGGTILQNGGTTLVIPSTAAGLSTIGYAIRAEVTFNNGVGSQVANSNSIVVTAPATKLSTPTNVSASDNRADGIQVSWTNVSNAATYGVWWGGVPSYDNNPDFGGPNNNGGKTITSSPFLDDGVTAGTTRNYYVQAFPTSGSTSFLKSDWSAGDSGTRISKLATPTNVSATDARTDGINVTWTAVSGANYYGVWYGSVPSYDSTPDFGGPNNPTLITGTSYLDTSMAAGVTRNYYVQAFITGNPAGTKSDWSAGDSGTRASAVSAPTNATQPTLSGSTSVGSTVTFGVGTWNNSPTSYDLRLYRGTQFVSSGETLVKSAGNVTSSTYTITSADFASGQLYLRAFASASNSGGSSGLVAGQEIGPITSGGGGGGAVPVLVSLTGNNSLAIGGTFSWSFTNSPTAYSIFVSGPTGTNYTTSNQFTYTGTSFRPGYDGNGWQGAGNYTINVVARNASGDSQIASVTTFMS